MFKINNENTRTTSMKSFSCFFFLDFEQVDLSWECAFKNTKTSAKDCSGESQTTIRQEN